MGSLTSLSSGSGNKWHVHQFPTDAGGGVGDEGGGGAVTGGHYNPKFQGLCTPDAAQDSCEVGDLSGKFGLLGIGATTHVATDMDSVASIRFDATPGSRGS